VTRVRIPPPPLLAWSWHRRRLAFLQDRILVSGSPSKPAWLKLDWAPVTETGTLDLEAFGALLERRPRVVAVAHVSNVLGTINPIAEVTRMAHEAGALVVVDGA
jgi:Aminotransferase class-V